MPKETMAKDCIHGYEGSHGKGVDDQNTIKMKTTIPQRITMSNVACDMTLGGRNGLAPALCWHAILPVCEQIFADSSSLLQIKQPVF